MAYPYYPQYNGIYPNNNSYQFNPYQQAQPQMQNMAQNQPVQPKRNIEFVTSLQEALSRIVEPNSCIFYRHQTEPLMYEILTDMEGRKVSHTYSFVESVSEVKPSQNNNLDLSSFITKDDFNKLNSDLETLKRQYGELGEQFKELKKITEI